MDQLPVSDADLVRASQAGDETAAEALYRRYFRSVWRYACARLGGDPHAAELALATHRHRVGRRRAVAGEDAAVGPLLPIGSRDDAVGRGVRRGTAGGQQDERYTSWTNPPQGFILPTYRNS